MNNLKPLSNQVADRLRKQLQEETSIFHKDGVLAMPINATSGKSYRGAAALILLMEQRPDPRWLSLKQASFNKTPVIKDQHGTLISFYKNSEMQPVIKDGQPELKENGKPKYEPVKLEEPKLETTFLFNAAQLKDMPAMEPGQKEPGEDRLQQILENAGVKPRPYYVVDQMVDWAGTGAEVKLPEVDEDKARLRNQIAGLFIAAGLGLVYEMPDYTFVVNTPDLLKKDPSELFKAANDAQRIADFVLGFEKKREQSKTLDKGDVIAYKSDTITVQAILKGGTAQVKNEEGKRWKVGPNDGLYKSLVEAKNNPEIKKEQAEELVMSR
jgi:antirestriction protein ArdC